MKTTTIVDVDFQGGVFRPIPATADKPGVQRMLFSIGPEQPKDQQQFFYTCPKSAIPDLAFELLMLWWECRLMKCLPHAGGWVQQPKVVRESFPVFEAQFRVVEQQRGVTTAALGAQMAMTNLMAAMGKGR